MIATLAILACLGLGLFLGLRLLAALPAALPDPTDPGHHEPGGRP